MMTLGMGINISLYSSIQLTLNLLLFILFVVVLSCPFGAQKDQKARHKVYKSNKTLLTSCKQHPSVVLFLPLLS